MVASLLSAVGLCRTYLLGEERVVGVDRVSVALGPGELVVLAGPSGSGKTTLLNLLGLLDRPDQGTISFEGREVTALAEPARARLRRERLGFVFQAHQLLPVLNAEENVALALWLRDWPEGECRRLARAALAGVGLEGLETRRPHQLSGGQRQRVAVARAVVGSPAVVLADEPTASLDSETALQLVELFDRIRRERGVSFLVATHDPRIVGRAGRQVRLRDGQVVADGALGEAVP